MESSDRLRGGRRGKRGGRGRKGSRSRGSNKEDGLASVPIRTLDRWIDEAAADLLILPRQARRLQPVELFALKRGQQRNWNRQCLLTAWSTYILAATFGAFPNTSFVRFLEQFSPPGYVPEDPARGKR